jgi:putative transposase
MLHLSATEHPTAQWTAQQVVNIFPFETAPRYLLRDGDNIYGAYFRQRIENMGIEEVMGLTTRPGPTLILSFGPTLNINKSSSLVL